MNAVIDALMAGDSPIGDKTICGLYQQYIADNGDVGTLASFLNERQREVKMLREEVLRAREDALADGLTGLLNRRGFDLALKNCLAMDGYARKPSLLIADIDHFKKINDSHGHSFGDRVIHAVADILRENVKGKDVAARYGGEEFIVLLPDTPLRGAQTLAEKIRIAVARGRFHRVDDKKACDQVTISIGVTHYRHGEAAANLVERADVALYASKTSGRNRVTVVEATAID